MKAVIYPLAIGLSILSLSACQRNTVLYDGISRKTVEQMTVKEETDQKAKEIYAISVHTGAVLREKTIYFSLSKSSRQPFTDREDVQFYLNGQDLGHGQDLEALYSTNNLPLQMRTGKGDLILETQLPYIPAIISLPELYPQGLIKFDKNTLIKWVADPANTGFVYLRFVSLDKDPRAPGLPYKEGIVYTTDDGQFEFSKALEQFDFLKKNIRVYIGRRADVECTDSKGQTHLIGISSYIEFKAVVQL